MARRSLKASTAGIEKAKKAFRIKEWTQEYLASEVGLETRQPIWKFFTGKPIERQTFMEICFQLGLDWQEIAELSAQSLLMEKKQDWDYCRYVDSLVQMVRSRRSDKIQVQCGTMRLLDIAQPIELEEIYVDVNVLNSITSQRWLDICELQSFVREFDRFGLSQCQERFPAMQAVASYPKLLILGKPGSGKTTFLQHIALQCDRGKCLPERIPIFIRLKNFAEDARETGDFSLLKYISQDLANYGVSDQQIQILLAHGRILFLLDGLDEISEDDSAKIVKTISKLSEEYYKNQFIITCRVATQEYRFEGFTDIEIADFDSCQIESFVQKWFVKVGKNSLEKGKSLANQFVQKLHVAENRQIRELAVSPLLLNLVCCMFQAHSGFPPRQVELYQQALDVLLNRWDEVRRIKRNENLSHFSLPHKLKLLSYIATITFKQERYFFVQSSVQQYIVDYLQSLSTDPGELEVLQLNSQAVLRSLSAHGILVEQARGIYSFSHLAFQEYLTAKNIVANPEPQILEKKLSDLVSHLTELRWHKVFLLTSGMLGRNATYLLLLMKQRIEALITADTQLQYFLVWLDRKSLSVQAPFKPPAMRAFYLTLVLLNDRGCIHDLTLSRAIDPRLADRLVLDAIAHLAVNQALVCHPQMRRSLQQLKEQLKEQLPAPDRSNQELNKRHDREAQAWAEKLRAVMLECCNIDNQSQFKQQQWEVLKQYYTATGLLVNCLKSGYEVTPAVQEQILAALCLPSTTTSDYVPDRYEIERYIGSCA